MEDKKGRQRQVTELDKSSCVCPPHHPFSAILHPCSALWLTEPKAHLVAKLPADDQETPDFTILTSNGLNTLLTISG